MRLHGSTCWKQIASLVPGRTAGQCNARYLHYLAPDINHDPFTPAEDAVIMAGYREAGSQWAIIATELPGRTGHAVKNRWQALSNRALGTADKAAGCGRPPRKHVSPSCTRMPAVSDDVSSPSTAYAGDAASSSSTSRQAELTIERLLRDSGFDAARVGAAPAPAADILLTFDFSDPSNSPLLFDHAVYDLSARV